MWDKNVQRDVPHGKPVNCKGLAQGTIGAFRVHSSVPYALIAWYSIIYNTENWFWFPYIVILDVYRRLLSRKKVLYAMDWVLRFKEQWLLY